MFRRIIGLVSVAGETWEERERRLKIRLQRCLEKCPVNDWSQGIQHRKTKLLNAIDAFSF